MTVYEKENDTLTGLYVQISVIPLYVETANPSMQKKKQKQTKNTEYTIKLQRNNKDSGFHS